MKFCRRLVLLSGLLLVPGFAFAAGSGGWTGPHIGVLVGVNNAAGDNTSTELAFSASFLAGYDFQLADHFVLGIGGFYEWNLKKTHTLQNGCTGSCDIRFGSSVYGVDGRIGFPVGAGNIFMPYIKVGYGRAKFSGGPSDSKSSPRYGVGIEWKSDTGTVSLLVEYLRQNIGNGTDNSIGKTANNVVNNNITIGANFFF
ncbi:MAG: outer membrane protein [Gammaproteobacteria bacterium]